MAEYGSNLVKECQVDMSDDGDDWDEPMIDDHDVTCLFCDSSFQTTFTLWEHCKVSHQVDITHVKHKFRLDFYGYIRMINFLRAEKPDCKVLCEYTPPFPWQHDRYLQPVVRDDPLLQYDIEGSDSEDDQNNTDERSRYNGSANQDSDDEMNVRLLSAMDRARQAETALQQALTDIEEMRAGVHSLVLGAEQEKKGRKEITSDEVPFDDEDSYFSSYSHYSIHEEMLKDKVRTLSYKNFMHKNRHLFEGKVVLDIGCGSGILSIFAAQAGAQKVIGIDKSSIVYHAMDVVRENKLDHIVTLKRGMVEEIDLDLKQVDIIISEWMGYFLLFESMLDTVLFARDKWLASGGKVYPDRCTMSIVGVEDRNRMNEKVTFWDDVYGVKMSCMKNLVLSEPVVDIVDPNTTLTSNCVVKIIVGYFDIFFEDSCMETVSFSTHPASPATHWKQTLFYLETPFSLQQGEIIDGVLECKKNRKDSRSLDIIIEIHSSISNQVLANKYTLQ